jgi:hypothetical protein
MPMMAIVSSMPTPRPDINAVIDVVKSFLLLKFSRTTITEFHDCEANNSGSIS